LKGELTFVGLRSPRALTACIVGLNAQPVGIPGVRFDPIGTGDAGQAIFRKERIVAETIQANFAIDVGLICGLAVGAEPSSDDTKEQTDKGTAQRDRRRQLLLALALWKIAKFLKDLSDGYRLRTECDLVLQSAKYKTKWKEANPADFPFEQVVVEAGRPSVSGKPAEGSLRDLIAKAGLPQGRHPLTLEFGG
jgi:hypothetical protein